MRKRLGIAGVAMSTIITLLLTGGPPFSDTGILPAFDLMIKAFPDAPGLLTDFMMGGASLLAVPAGILAGVLVHYINKKDILFFTHIIFLISAIFGGSVENIWYIAVMRAVNGMAYGAMTTVSLGLIADLWKGDDCGTMMGLYNGIQAGQGMIMAVIGGFAAAFSWKYPFYMFAVYIPLLYMIWKYIPDTGLEKIEVKEEEKFKDRGRGWGRVIALALAAFGVSCIYCTIYMEISIYVAERQIGTSVLAGNVSAAGTFGSLVAGFLFPILYKRFHRFLPILYTAVMVFAFAAFSRDIPGIAMIVIWFLAGTAYSVSMSYYFTYVTTICDPQHQSLALAFANSGLNLGMFASVYFISISKMLLEKQHLIELLPYFTGLLIIAGILSLVLALYDQKIRNRV